MNVVNIVNVSHIVREMPPGKPKLSTDAIDALRATIAEKLDPKLPSDIIKIEPMKFNKRDCSLTIKIIAKDPATAELLREKLSVSGESFEDIWESAQRKNFGRNDDPNRTPLPEPKQTASYDRLVLDFETLFPRQVFLGTDEPVLARKIMSLANKAGFHITSKAIHHAIRSWMDDLKSVDENAYHKIRVLSLCCGAFRVVIERDNGIYVDKRYTLSRRNKWKPEK